MFAGVLGVGLYPLMGTRVWCGRGHVNKEMCVSCGNCFGGQS